MYPETQQTKKPTTENINVIDNRKVAISLAKAHIESTFTDYMVFAFNREEKPFKLEEFGNVGSQEVLQRMYELFLSKIETKTPYSE